MFKTEGGIKTWIKTNPVSAGVIIIAIIAIVGYGLFNTKIV